MQLLASLQSNWTVGLIATVGTILCVVAADTGAYFVGRSMGRTKLTDVSPKKTVEGAVGGLASSIGMALLLHKLVAWPAAPLEACAMGVSATSGPALRAPLCCARRVLCWLRRSMLLVGCAAQCQLWAAMPELLHHGGNWEHMQSAPCMAGTRLAMLHLVLWECHPHRHARHPH